MRSAVWSILLSLMIDHALFAAPFLHFYLHAYVPLCEPKFDTEEASSSIYSKMAISVTVFCFVGHGEGIEAGFRTIVPTTMVLWLVTRIELWSILRWCRKRGAGLPEGSESERTADQLDNGDITVLGEVMESMALRVGVQRGSIVSAGVS